MANHTLKQKCKLPYYIYITALIILFEMKSRNPLKPRHVGCLLLAWLLSCVTYEVIPGTIRQRILSQLCCWCHKARRGAPFTVNPSRKVRSAIGHYRCEKASLPVLEDSWHYNLPQTLFDTLSPERTVSDNDFVICIMNIFCDIAARWMPQNLTDNFECCPADHTLYKISKAISICREISGVLFVNMI